MASSVMFDPAARDVFEPLPGLIRNDSHTVFLAILPNRVAYVKPIDDPVFSAHRPWQSVNADGIPNEPLYLPDHPGRVIGCTVQVVTSLADHISDVITNLY